MFSILLISSPENFADEHKLIEAMFELGLEGIFARKPHLSDDLMERWKLGIDFKWHNKILDWHGSAHSFADLHQVENRDMILLSPVFDSISKEGYKSKFSREELKNGIADWRKLNKTTKIYALGGVDDENIKELPELGFDGAAILGAVWNYADPLGAFSKIRSAIL
ncbi:thiamine phosphate synthase [Fibrobacterales bacterium]|nr:thiamine phosphate synthase [Fibrobacterales bacterium]